MSDIKVCPRCGKELPIGDFYLCDNGKYLPYCKGCYKDINHKRYLAYGHDVTYLNRYRSKMNISSLAKTAKQIGIDISGKELHHWNYNIPRQVYIMSRNAHRKLHRFLKVNNDDNYVYTKDNVCLDTSDKAEVFYKKIFNKLGITEPLRLIAL